MKPAMVNAELVVRAARNIDLELAADHVPGVVRYFELVVQMGELVNGFPLDACDEQASTFTPCAPTPD